MNIKLFAGVHENIFDGEMIQIHIVATQIRCIKSAPFLAAPWKNGGLSAQMDVAAVHHAAEELTAIQQKILIFHAVDGAVDGLTVKGV